MPPYYVDTLESGSQITLTDIESIHAYTLFVNSRVVRLPNGKLATYCFDIDSEAAIVGVAYSVLTNALIQSQAQPSDLVYGEDNKICGVVSMRTSNINDISPRESRQVNYLKEHPTLEILLASGLSRLMALCWRLKVDLDPRYFEFIFIKLSENTKNLIQLHGRQPIHNGQATYQIEACNLIKIDNEPYAVLAVMNGYFYLENMLWTKNSVTGRFQRACVVTRDSLIEQLNLYRFQDFTAVHLLGRPSFLRSGFYWALRRLSKSPVDLNAFQMQFYSALLEQMVLYNPSEIRGLLISALRDTGIVDRQLSIMNEENDNFYRLVMSFQGGLDLNGTLLVSYSTLEAWHNMTKRAYGFCRHYIINDIYQHIWAAIAEVELIKKYHCGHELIDKPSEIASFCKLVEYIMLNNSPEKHESLESFALSVNFISHLRKAIAEAINVHFYPRELDWKLCDDEKKKIRILVTKPIFLSQLAIKDKKISAPVVANAIWLSSKDENEVKSNLNAYSLWARNKNIPVQRKEIEDCMSRSYIMPKP